MNLATMWHNLKFTHKWQVRCPSCGRKADLAELGLRRDAPRGMLKRSFGWCRSCRTVRLFEIEPARDDAAR
jgi:hypothetical protein